MKNRSAFTALEIVIVLAVLVACLVAFRSKASRPPEPPPDVRAPAEIAPVVSAPPVEIAPVAVAPPVSVPAPVAAKSPAPFQLSPREQVRVLVIVGLTSDKIDPAVLLALSHPDGNISSAAAFALDRIRSRHPDLDWKRSQSRVERALREQALRSRDRQKAGATGPDPWKGLLAVADLDKLGGHEVLRHAAKSEKAGFGLRLLGSILGSGSFTPMVQAMAIRTAGLTNAEVHAVVVDLASGPEGALREQALRALEEMSAAAPATASTKVLQLLKDPSPRVRRSAAESLERVPASAEVDRALEAASADPDPDVRLSVYTALLARIPATSVAPLARRCIADGSSWVQAAGIRALARPASSDPAALAVLVEILNGTNAPNAEEAVIALQHVKTLPASAAPGLLKALDGRYDAGIEIACRLLGRIGPGARIAMPRLQALAGDPARAKMVQDAARKATADIEERK